MKRCLVGLWSIYKYILYKMNILNTLIQHLKDTYVDKCILNMDIAHIYFSPTNFPHTYVYATSVRLCVGDTHTTQTKFVVLMFTCMSCIVTFKKAILADILLPFAYVYLLYHVMQIHVTGKNSFTGFCMR
jgi:hypothetical protein